MDLIILPADGVTSNYLLDLNSSLTQMIGETQPGSSSYYLLGLDVIGQQQGANWSYFGYDGLGSVRQVTNSAGTIGYSANYDPYGTPLEQFGTLPTNLGFTGEYTDPSGQLYLRARYANPSTGTFISRDPFEGYMQRAMSRNGYSYVEGNPVNFADSSGRFPFLAIGIILTVALVGSAAHNLFVDQGRGVGGAHQFDPAECIDWGDVARAMGAAGLGLGEALAGVLLSPFYAGRNLRNYLDGRPLQTPREINRDLLGWIGLGDEYDQLINNLYFNVGSLAGDLAVIAVSLGSFTKISQALQGGRTAILAASNGTRVTVQLVSAGSGQMVIGVIGAAGAAGQVILKIKGTSSGGEPPCNGVLPCTRSQTGNTSKNAEILEESMAKAGNPRPSGGGYAPHHIVPSTDKDAEAARNILERFGIDINSHLNGVWLSHPTPHLNFKTRAYIRNVTSLLNGAQNQGDAVKVLQFVRSGLANGTFPY